MNNKASDKTWAEQNRQGRDLADALVSRMRTDQNPLLLRDTLAELFSDSERNGERVGFVQKIAEDLMDL